MADPARLRRKFRGEDISSVFAREEWIITNASDEEDALAAPGAPLIGDFLNGDPATEMQATRREVDSENPRNAYLMRVEYRPPGGGGGGPAEAFADPSVEGENVVVRAWRVPSHRYTLKFPPDLSAPPEDFDMEGHPVDDRGEAVSWVLRNVVRTHTYRVLKPAPEGLYHAHQLTRNQTQVGPYPAGTLLFRDYKIDSDGIQFHRVKLTFLFDQWAHLRQQALTDADNNVLVWGRDNYPGTAEEKTFWKGHAQDVTWYQPFPFTSLFINLFPQSPGS